MKFIIKFTFFLLFVSLAFGSFNPFDLRGSISIDEYVSEQRGFTPILFCFCMLFSVCDAQVRIHLKQFRKYFIPLLFLLLFYVMSSLIYDVSTFGDHFSTYVKLLVAFTGFFVFCSYFYTYPQICQYVCTTFAITCMVICIMFFAGMLDGLYFFSNGRLWMFGENPNTYSFVMGVGALVMSNELKEKRHFIIKLLCMCSILIFIMYIFLSGSRGTIVFLGLALIINSWSYLKTHLGISSFCVALGVVAIFAFLSKNADELVIFDRFHDLEKGDSREGLIKNALSLFYDRPLYGYGVNGYEYMKLRVFNDLRDSHNMIVSIMAVSGLLGLISILTFYFQIIKLLKSTPQAVYSIALFVYVFCISMKTGGIITYSLMWITYATVLAQTYTIKNKTV